MRAIHPWSFVLGPWSLVLLIDSAAFISPDRQLPNHLSTLLNRNGMYRIPDAQSRTECALRSLLSVFCAPCCPRPKTGVHVHTAGYFQPPTIRSNQSETNRNQPKPTVFYSAGRS